MPGGLMQLVSQGQQNIILNSNPTKSFFKSTFHNQILIRRLPLTNYLLL